MKKLENFGNFEGYTPETRVVRLHTPVYSENNGIVKMYSMLCEKTKPFNNLEMSMVRFYIKEGLDENKIDPKIGLGFAMLFEDVLNINMWGGDYPSLLNPNIYPFERGGSVPLYSIREGKSNDVKDVGAYCAWEGAIVGHESKAWREYMLSKRTEQDKALWLKDVCSGKIKDAPKMPSDSEGNIRGTDSMWGYLWPGKFDDYRLITLEDKAYLCEFDADRHRITKFEKGKALRQYGGLHSGEVREDWFYLWIESYEESFN